MEKHNFHLSIKDFYGLYKVARLRHISPINYFTFQKYQGNLLVRYLKSRGINLSNTKVLDLGSGLCGYSSAFKESGACVTSVDLVADYKFDDVSLVKANGYSLPFESSNFDLVICASLIEHVSQPDMLLRELIRVLRRDGMAYLSYPPFYSPLGGHQFAPFHLCGESIALFIARKRGLYNKSDWLQEKHPLQPQSYSQAYGEWGLYPLTISRVDKLLKGLPVKMIERSTRWMSLDFSGIPLIGEFLTWHVQFLFTKI